MLWKKDLQMLIKRYSVGIPLLILPLILNVLLWKSVTLPQQLKLRELRDKQLLIALKPKLEALLLQSRQLLEEKNASFMLGDPSAAMQTLERLAGRQQVEIKQIHTKNERSSAQTNSQQTKPLLPGFSTPSIHMEVTGSFDKLARWVSEVEAEPSLLIDSWILESAKDSRQPHRLIADITVFLREN